jgi:hypothetical protein
LRRSWKRKIGMRFNSVNGIALGPIFRGFPNYVPLILSGEKSYKNSIPGANPTTFLFTST